MAKDILFILFLILMFFILIALIFVAVKINSNGAKCLADPLIYGVKQMDKINNGSSCYCSYNKVDSPMVVITSGGYDLIR